MNLHGANGSALRVSSGTNPNNRNRHRQGANNHQGECEKRICLGGRCLLTCRLLHHARKSDDSLPLSQIDSSRTLSTAQPFQDRARVFTPGPHIRMPRLRSHFPRTMFPRVGVGEHLEMIGATDLLARVDVDENCHCWSLFSLRRPNASLCGRWHFGRARLMILEQSM
jgi:hypothetical protein